MTVRIICVGLGGRGRGWVNDCIHSADVDFAGMVDLDHERLALAADKLGVAPEQCFTSFDAAVAATAPDAALLVTPNVLHEEHIELCLDRGLHVLCEKPFVMHRDSGRRLVAKAREKGLVAQAVQNYRWSPTTLTVRELVRGGAVGAPDACVIDFHRLRPIRGMPHPLLYNQGIHHLDAVRWVFGADPLWVTAWTWNPPWHDCDGDTSIEATYGLDNGVVFHYSGNYSTRGRNTPYSGVWRVECAEGSIHCGGDVEAWVRIERGDVTEDVTPIVDELGGNRRLLQTFAAAIAGDGPAPTDAADNLKSLEMIWSAVESAQRGARVEIEDGPMETR